MRTRRDAIPFTLQPSPVRTTVLLQDAPEAGLESPLIDHRAGHTRCCEFLLNNGVKLSTVDKRGRTAIHYAARMDQQATLEFLIHYPGADPAAVDSWGRTALHWAAFYGYKKCCKLLIQAGGTLCAPAPSQPHQHAHTGTGTSTCASDLTCCSGCEHYGQFRQDRSACSEFERTGKGRAAAPFLGRGYPCRRQEELDCCAYRG